MSATSTSQIQHEHHENTLNFNAYKKFRNQTLIPATRISPMSRRVLIIDDDMDTADALKFMVEAYGNTICEVVYDPYEALLALSDRRFDFVLVDQKMPGLEGSQVLTEIDEQVDKDPLIGESGRFSSSIPTVLMSGSDIKLESNYNLRNFTLIETVNKRDLVNLLDTIFAI